MPAHQVQRLRVLVARQLVDHVPHLVIAATLHRLVGAEHLLNAGGERAAAIFSLLESAKLNGIDPEAYLTELLRRVAGHPINWIGELLPWNLFPANPAREEAA